MKTTFLILSALAISVFFFSCDESRQELTSNELVNNLKVTFDLEDKLNFFYETKPNFDFSQVYQDSIALLVSANKIQHSIDFYRLDNGEKIDSVMLSLEGPNGVPSLNNFLYYSDTLYVTNPFFYELVLFDLSGIALKRIRIRPTEQYESLLPRHFTPSQIVKKGDLVYLSGDPDLNISDPEAYKKGRYLFEVNVKTGAFRSIFEVAKVYEKDRWMVNQYFYRQMYDEERGVWLFSFEVDDSLRLYDLNGSRKSFFAGSFVSGEIDMWTGPEVSSDRAYRYYLSQKSYGKLIHDKKNHLYYRFVNHPNKEAFMTGKLEKLWFRSFSIVTLNESLEWVGETDIKDKAFGEFHISTNDGIYLSYFKEEEAKEGVKTYVKLKPIWLDEKSKQSNTP